MMVLACIGCFVLGCFVLGGIVGVFVMGLCVASSNNNVELENRQKEDK